MRLRATSKPIPFSPFLLFKAKGMLTSTDGMRSSVSAFSHPFIPEDALRGRSRILTFPLLVGRLKEEPEESDTELEECDTENGELTAEIDSLTSELGERFPSSRLYSIGMFREGGVIPSSNAPSSNPGYK
ncbi:uncharacterized protein AAGF69_015195 isoform 2-T3 [Amazona ochrocephala]